MLKKLLKPAFCKSTDHLLQRVEVLESSADIVADRLSTIETTLLTILEKQIEHRAEIVNLLTHSTATAISQDVADQESLNG